MSHSQWTDWHELNSLMNCSRRVIRFPFISKFPYIYTYIYMIESLFVGSGLLVRCRLRFYRAWKLLHTYYLLVNSCFRRSLHSDFFVFFRKMLADPFLYAEWQTAASESMNSNLAQDTQIPAKWTQLCIGRVCLAIWIEVATGESVKRNLTQNVRCEWTIEKKIIYASAWWPIFI